MAGTISGRPTDFFPGKIDEVRLYEKTLSEADIQKVMETPQDVEGARKTYSNVGEIEGRILKDVCRSKSLVGEQQPHGGTYVNTYSTNISNIRGIPHMGTQAAF